MKTHYPVVKCDGDDGMCDDFALDHTLGGLGNLVGSETQLPDGWVGDKPADRGDEHYCPSHASERKVTPRRTSTEQVHDAQRLVREAYGYDDGCADETCDDEHGDES